MGRIPQGLRARFRRARKPHFFQYVCAMTYYIQAHHATSLHNLPKPHVWQCVCVMQFSINIIMELAYATLQHCITHVSSTFFTLSPCYMKYRWIMLKGEGGGGGRGGATTKQAKTNQIEKWLCSNLLTIYSLKIETNDLNKMFKNTRNDLNIISR